jgi:hypothetical protein
MSEPRTMGFLPNLSWLDLNTKPPFLFKETWRMSEPRAHGVSGATTARSQGQEGEGVRVVALR